ncbi:hypothetical protein Tco_1002165 [Tanacetum coccineum]|uniref:BTB domain-containing protein n=1 Tax=Tanacetum coccineum TaxID=301880 RepID=A0ABQ5F7C5_9ASTR
MNPQETQQVAARDEKWVPFIERVKISSTNIRMETTVPQKEETFQVVIDLVKNSSCFKAFTISTANKKCVVNADVFRTILDNCPKVKGVNFTDVPDDDTTLAFLIKLGYKGPLYKHTNMFVDHMYQPWITLAAIINKCLSGKTSSNDKLCEDYQEYGLSIPETMLTEAIKQSESYQMFIKYSTSQIPPKKSRGKVKRKTSSKRRVKKKVTLSSDDNITSDDPDTALELGKSISQTKAEEAEATRKVYDTHARIVTKSVPEPTKKRKSGKVTSDPPKNLKGVPSLTLEKQEVADIMQALKESKKTSKRQPGLEQESEYSKEDKLNDEEKDDKEGDADDENDETEYDEDDIYKYKIRVRTDEDEEMLNDKVDDSEKGDEEVTDVVKADAEKTSKVKNDPKKTELPPINSSLSVSLGFGDQFLKLSSDSSLVSILKDTTDAEINSLLEVKIQSEVLHTQSPSMLNALSAVQLRVAKLEKDVSDLKKKDISIKALSALKTQVPSIVDNYFGSKVGNILKIKKEQAEKQKMLKFTIKYTNKVALKEYDQKSALYQTMHAKKSFNRNPANHRLYHALMEALIEDENAIDKGVADTGKQTKRRRTKDSESSKKPSTTKETPKGKAPSKGSKTGKSALEKEPVKEPIAEVVMDDASDDVVHDDDQPQDASEPKTTKTPNPDWFKQPPRPLTLDSEWNKRQVVLDQPEQPWFNQMVSTTKDSFTFNDLRATPIDFSKYVLNRLKIDNLTQDILLGPAYNLLKGTCSSRIELEYHFQKCFNALTDKIDWNNLEGDHYPFDLSKPLPLQGHLGHLTVTADYFFNNDLEYLKSFDLERTYTTSITKTKAAWYEIEGIEYMVPMLWTPTKVGSQLKKLSKHNVYSTKKILGVKSVIVKKLHGYGHLEEIMLFHLTDSDIVDFIVALRMFTRSLTIKKRVKDLQLGVESYQKKLNITLPQQTVPEIEFKELYTPSHKPSRVIYEDLNKQKRVMRADELYKFSNGTLKKVREEIHYKIRDFRLEYNTKMPRRKWTAIDRKRSELMVELIDKQMRE